MADTEDTEGRPPPFDSSELLGQLKKIVDDNRSAGGGGKSWLSTLIIIAVVLAGIAAWSWFSWRRNRELARLRHEKNKAKILAEKAAVDRHIAENDAAIAKANTELAVAEESLRVIEADIRAEEGRYEADLRAIDSIRSWRDIDRSVRR